METGGCSMSGAVVPMNSLCEGEVARVERILPENALRGRLQDLGLIEGTQIECIRRSPAGDPIAFRFREAVIALRGVDSSRVLVRVLQRGSVVWK